MTATSWLVYGVFSLAIVGALIAILSQILINLADNAKSAPCIGSPLIGKRNASKVLLRRFSDVKLTFENAMRTPGWQILRSGDNISIETIEAKEGWPLFIRTTAYFSVAPSVLYEAFHWEIFEKTQSKIDPFYESSQSLLHVSKNVHLIRKAFIETHQDKPTQILESVGLHHQRTKGNASEVAIDDHIPRHTLVHGLINFNATLEFQQDFTTTIHNNNKSRDSSSYVRAFQDLIAWFVETETKGVTKLIICMRVDLGEDIPRWAFLTTVAATGLWSMQALRAVADDSIRPAMVSEKKKGWLNGFLRFIRVKQR